MMGLGGVSGPAGEPWIDGRPPRLPDGVRVYAIGDVHGRLDLLTELEDMVLGDATRPGAPRDVHIVHLGDYVDRGPDSRGVLDRLTEPLHGRVRRVLLCGNHDQWFKGFLNSGRWDPNWLDYGGRETLASYGVGGARPGAREAEAHAELARAILPRHRRLLTGLQPTWRLGDYLFCHAGVRPGRPLDRQTAEDLYWIREPFLSWRGAFGAVVVHGHTVVERPELRANRIGIDTGAVWTGRLTCLVLEGDRRRFITTGGAG